MKNKLFSFFNTIALSLMLLIPQFVFAEPLVWDPGTDTFLQPPMSEMESFGDATYASESMTYNANATNTRIDRFLVITQDLINWASAIILVIIIVYVVINGVRLANYGDNPSERRETLTRLFYCGIALMVLGSLWTIGSLAAGLF